MHHHFAQYLAATVALAATGTCWAANKCVLGDGRLIYQDAPCPTSAKAEVVAKQPLTEEEQTRARWDREMAQLRKSTEDSEARQRANQERWEAGRIKEKIKLEARCGKLLGTEPAVGMTEDELFWCSTHDSWGPRTTRIEQLPFEYRVYYYPRKGRAIVVRDGKVTEVRVVSLGTVR